MRVSPKGDRLFYSSWIEALGSTGAGAFASSPKGRAFAAGYRYYSGLHQMTPGAFQETFQGGQSDGFVTTLDLYLEGVTPFGGGDASCQGEILSNATSMPQSGDPNFSVYASQVPPRAQGWLTVIPPSTGSGRSPGADVLLAHQPIQVIPVRADQQGFVETKVSLAGMAAGTSITYVSTCGQPTVARTEPRSSRATAYASRCSS